jgi:hypothetical protein
LIVFVIVFVVVSGVGRHHGAVGGRHDFKAAADGVHALHHIAQSDAALGMQGDALGIEAVAVVADAQRDAVRLAGQRDVNAAGAGMAFDIGQRLLRQPEQHGVGDVGQGVGTARRLKVYRGSARQGVLLGQVLQGGGQAEVVQDGRAQVVRNAAHLGHHVAELVGGMLEHRLRRLLLLGLARRQPDHPGLDLQLDRHQPLADAVMQVARQPRPFLFLRLDHALGQHLELGVGHAQLADVQATPELATATAAAIAIPAIHSMVLWMLRDCWTSTWASAWSTSSR